MRKYRCRVETGAGAGHEICAGIIFVVRLQLVPNAEKIQDCS